MFCVLFSTLFSGGRIKFTATVAVTLIVKIYRKPEIGELIGEFKRIGYKLLRFQGYFKAIITKLYFVL